MRILALRMSAHHHADFLAECQRGIQPMQELCDLERLGQIVEEAGLEAALDVARHGVGAQGDDRDMRRQRIGAQSSQGFDAADARQIDIHHDHPRLVGAGKLDAQISVRGAQQLEVGALRYDLLDQFEIGRIVFHVQHQVARRAVRWLRPRERRQFGLPHHQQRRGRQPQFDPEHAADAHLAVRADAAAHEIDQPLAHHQTDPGALLARSPPGPGD